MKEINYTKIKNVTTKYMNSLIKVFRENIIKFLDKEIYNYHIGNNIKKSINELLEKEHFLVALDKISNLGYPSEKIEKSINIMVNYYNNLLDKILDIKWELINDIEFWKGVK